MSVEPRFRPGDRVRVRAADPPGHIRTPSYVRGRTGVVEAVHGSFRNPEELAYGKDGLPNRPLYLVSFDHDELWGPGGDPRTDRNHVDIYEHWLEPAEEKAQR
jgi:hypothetical protein